MPSTKPESNFINHFIAAFFGIGAHPFRVLMNRAAYHTDPRKVFRDFPTYWRVGLGMNLTRGVSAVALQSYVKNEVHAYYGQDTHEGKYAGWLAASCMGTFVATFLETPFIRKSTVSPGTSFAYMRFSLPLIANYFLREAGFSAVILSKKEIPENWYYPIMLSAASITGTCHKLAAWDATADLVVQDREFIKNKWVTPNLKRDGVYSTLRGIAYGNVYNHPSCAVPIKNPITQLQLMRNLLHVSCHPNMFLFRLLFIGIYKSCYDYGYESSSTIKNKASLATQSLFKQTRSDHEEPKSAPPKP